MVQVNIRANGDDERRRKANEWMVWLVAVVEYEHRRHYLTFGTRDGMIHQTATTAALVREIMEGHHVYFVDVHEWPERGGDGPVIASRYDATFVVAEQSVKVGVG